MKIVQEFDIERPIAEIFSEINNIGEIGYCVAGVKEVREISPDLSEWVVLVRAGIITRTFRIRGLITERQPPSLLRFAGTTQDIEVEGLIGLTSLGPTTTRCSCTVEFEVGGALAPLIDLMAKGPQQRMINETVANLRVRLEQDETGARPASPAPVVVGPQTVAGRLWSWLAGVFGGYADVAALAGPVPSTYVDVAPAPGRTASAPGLGAPAVPRAAPALPANSEGAAAYPHVFEPIQIGPVSIPNRFYLCPHGVPLITGGPGGTSVPSDRFAKYYAERARGGVGLLIHSISLPPLSRNLASAVHPGSVPAFAHVAKAVHDCGSKIFGQLHYSSLTGGKWASLSPDLPVFGSSSNQRVEHFGTLHAMTEAEIKGFIGVCAVSARHLAEAGYDGIEVHCSHGVLIEHFLSPYFNKRTDRWGGSLENRMRLLVSVLEAVRAEGGSSLAYGIRLNCDEMLAGGLDQEDAREVLRVLIDKGLIDFADLDVAVEPQQAPLMTAPPFIPPLHIASFIENVRTAATDIVVIGALGRVTTVREADDAIASGVVDMVGAARALIAEPELINNARAGREDRSRKCIACNYCMAALFDGGFGCVINPTTGREDKWGLQVRDGCQPKERVVVVGGGPAGLEAARVAADRGHTVILFEARETLGGQLTLWGQLPDRETFLSVAPWYEGRLAELGVDVRLGQTATVENVLAERPDAVIVASGSQYERNGETGMLAVAIPGWDRPRVYSPEDILERGLRPGGRVVVLDEEGINTGPGLAEILALAGAEVTIVTRQFHLGPRLVYDMNLPFVLPRLADLGVRIRTTTHIKEIGERDVVVFDILTNVEETLADVDAVVLAGMRKPVGDLAARLEGRVETLLVIGDALAPRGFADATFEGHRFARGVGDPKAPKTMAEAFFPEWTRDLGTRETPSAADVASKRAVEQTAG